MVEAQYLLRDRDREKARMIRYLLLLGVLMETLTCLGDNYKEKQYDR